MGAKSSAYRVLDGNLKERDVLVNGTIILKWVLKKQYRRMCAGITGSG
jgi:hypothetical protein